jgi:hypothetical protein
MKDINEKLLKARKRILEERYVYSLYHQVKEIAMLPEDEVKTILEIGPGAGYFKMIMHSLGYSVKTLDIQKDFEPDYLYDIRSLSDIKMSFDAVCAFEIMEHIPYEDFRESIKKISYIALRYVYFSFPYQCRQLFCSFQLPRLSYRKLFSPLFKRNEFSFIINNPLERDIVTEQFKDRTDKHNPHYWEIGRKSYPEKRVLADIQSSGLKVIKKFHSKIYPYHFFVLCKKIT